MESKAQYALIGTLVIAFLIAVMSAVLWLSGSDLDQDYDEYTVTFQGPIRGVQEAAEVRFNGIKVGEVTALRLDPDDPNRVLVKIEVFQETPVDTASYAQLEAQGLTGLNIIQLFSGGGEFPLLKDMPGKGPYIIQGRGSTIDNLLTDGGSVVESVQKTLNVLLDALDEQSIQDFRRILDNVANITSEYRNDPITAKRIEITLANIDQASKDVSGASIAVDETARDTQKLVNEQVVPIIAKVEMTMAQIDKTLLDTQALLNSSKSVTENTDTLIKEISSGSLRDLEIASANLNDLLITLNRVADELERNPSKFVIGEKREVLELPK